LLYNGLLLCGLIVVRRRLKLASFCTFVMRPPSQTAAEALSSQLVRPFVRSSIRSSVHSETYEQDILKTKESVLMQIGRSCPQGKGMKRSTLGVRRVSRSHEAVDLEARRRHHARSFGSSRLSSSKG